MAMTKDNKMALGMCFWPSSASSAAVLIASYPKTAKNTVAALVSTGPKPAGMNGS
jgi:hypothetical protein